MKQVKIAVGIICNPAGEIFITRRAADVHMGGKCEFPGGKIEAGETPDQAMIRELAEEVGIVVQRYSLYQQLEHQFSDRRVALSFFLVTEWQGEPFGKEGQPGCWMKRDALNSEEFPEANAPVIARLRAATE